MAKKKRTMEEILVELFEASAEESLRLVKAGEMTPALLKEVRGMLKDNAISIEVENGDPAQELTEEISEDDFALLGVVAG